MGKHGKVEKSAGALGNKEGQALGGRAGERGVAGTTLLAGL